MTKQTQFLDRLIAAKRTEFRRVLVFGPSRAGKTTFLGSAAFDPRTSPILILDFGGGSASLTGIPKDLVSIFPVESWDDFEDAYAYLDSGDHPFKAVAIDSLSDTHLYSLLNVVDQEIASNKKRTDRLDIWQGDYGKAMIQMRRFLIAIRTLPMHSFFTALTKTENEPKEGWVRKPALFGQMSEEVVGMFDTTGFISIAKSGKKEVNSRRVLALQNYAGIRVGVRTPFGAKIPNDITLGEQDGVTQLFDILQVPALDQ